MIKQRTLEESVKNRYILRKGIYRIKSIKLEEKEMSGREELKRNSTASSGKTGRM